MPVSRDTIVAILLMAFTGLMWNATYDIEVTPYASMASNIWPRIIIVALGLFSALLLVRSIVVPEPKDPDAERLGAVGLLGKYRNALIVYALFFGFLLILPTLGMLLGASAFVFLALTFLGRPEVRLIPIHAAISIGSVGFMWAIFTFALRVILPEGEILTGLN